MMASRDAWNAWRPFTGGSASDLDLDNDLMPSRPQSRESLHRPSSREVWVQRLHLADARAGRGVSRSRGTSCREEAA